jgi:hypothetical protein
VRDYAYWGLGVGVPGFLPVMWKRYVDVAMLIVKIRSGRRLKLVSWSFRLLSYRN